MMFKNTTRVPLPDLISGMEGVYPLGGVFRMCEIGHRGLEDGSLPVRSWGKIPVKGMGTKCPQKLRS